MTQTPTAAVKFVGGSQTRLRILAIPFFGPKELGGRDLDGEFFSAKTDLCTSWYPVQRPLLYEHGLRPGPDVAPVGKVDSATLTTEEGVGVWVEAELDRQARYFEHIRRLVEQKRLYASSGAMPHLVKTAPGGEILRWPWVELSLTPVPANPFAVVEPDKVRKHWKAAGLALPEAHAPPAAEGAPDRGSGAAPEDGREPKPEPEPEDEPDPIELSEPTGLRYAAALDRLLVDVPVFVARTESLVGLRAKVGRALSSARRARLVALLEAFDAGAADLRALLAETDPAPQDAGPDAAAEEKAAPPADVPLAELRARLAAWQPHPTPVSAAAAAPAA
jgi:hypothetical protein